MKDRAVVQIATIVSVAFRARVASSSSGVVPIAARRARSPAVVTGASRLWSVATI
jgi:hypothetical protein